MAGSAGTRNWLAVAAVALAVGGAVGLGAAKQRQAQVVVADREVFRFASALTRISVSTRGVAADTWDRALERVRADPAEAAALSHYPGLWRGTDPWGQPYVYEVVVPGRVVHIRSRGPDGRDDGGEGDDIQYAVDVRWMFEQRDGAR
jgi:hypothetical protein